MADRVMAGPDPLDPDPPNTSTARLPSAVDYVEALKGAGLKGARIGVLRSKFANPMRRQPVGVKAYRCV